MQTPNNIVKRTLDNLILPKLFFFLVHECQQLPQPRILPSDDQFIPPEPSLNILYNNRQWRSFCCKQKLTIVEGIHNRSYKKIKYKILYIFIIPRCVYVYEFGNDDDDEEKGKKQTVVVSYNNKMIINLVHRTEKIPQPTHPHTHTRLPGMINIQSTSMKYKIKAKIKKKYFYVT